MTSHQEGTADKKKKEKVVLTGLSGVNLRMSFSVYARKKFHTKGLGEILDQHRKGIHEQFSQILSTIEKNKTPELNAPTFAITTRSGTRTRDPLSQLHHNQQLSTIPGRTTEEEGPGGEEPSIMQNKESPYRKKDDDDERFLSIFQQIHINLPFLEAIIHMSKGVKVLKYILSHKEKLEKAASSVKLSEECSAVIKRSLPRKEEDLRSLTLPCLIGPLAVKNALDDLGASINLMSHSLFRRLGISKLKPTRMSVQLADRSNIPSGFVRIF
ncbi:putative reverse transcriptase domain-containing protein [Tanacetum coccineum]